MLEDKRLRMLRSRRKIHVFAFIYSLVIFFILFFMASDWIDFESLKNQLESCTNMLIATADSFESS